MSGHGGLQAPASERDVNLKARYYIAGKRFDAKARVMAVAEGWAMCRYRGCMPFVVPVSHLRIPNG